MTEKIHDPLPPLRTLLLRGVCKQCPQCGARTLFKRWVALHEHCSNCGLQFLENQGDLWGYLLFIDRGLFILPLIVMIYFRLSNPDSIWFYLIGGTMIFALFYTLPHRTGLSLAINYYIRRKSDEDTGVGEG